MHEIGRNELPSPRLTRAGASHPRRGAWSPSRVCWGFGIAVWVTSAFLGARLWFWPPSDKNPDLILFMLPIMLSAYVGGLGPGLVSTVLAALGTNYFLSPQFHPLSIGVLLHSAQWLGLILSGTAISLVCEESMANSERGGGSRRP